MSSITIEGAKSKTKANVDENGLLEVKAFNQTFEERLTEEGVAFNLNTGTIAFGAVGGTEHGVSYLKNNGDDLLVVTGYIYLFGVNTGGAATENGLVQIYENPTGGTLLSSTAGTPRNRNVGSKETLEVDWRIGASGKTVSGGNVIIETLFSNPTGRQVVSVATAIPKGNAVAITFTPQASISAQSAQFAMSVYKDTLKLGGI
jgi:hypothetical protein